MRPLFRAFLRPLALVGSFLASVATGGCAEDTAILVEVDSGDLTIPADIDELRIRAVGLETGALTDRLFTVETAFPHSLAIVPGGASSSEMVRVTVWGRRAGARVVRRVLTTAFREGETVTLPVNLPFACLRVMCEGEAVDCRDGVCVGEMPPADGGVDMGGLDMGPPRDLGPESDLGPGDEDLGATDDDLGAGDEDMFVPPAGFDGLIISEYVEGSGFNKAIELYNGTGGTVDLSMCRIELHRDGTPGGETLSFAASTLAADATYVFCEPRIADTTPCDEETGKISHNGNDAYEIICDGATVDSFGSTDGTVGTDWSSGGVSTIDQTLRRVCPPTPDTDVSDGFDPSAEWTELASNTFDGLGLRACPGNP